MYTNVNDFKKNNFFPVFDCILENSLKNIFQCLEQRKMKKWKKLETHYKCKSTTAIHCKSTANHHKKNPQTTITAKRTQSNPLQSTANHHNHEQHRFWRKSTSELESTAKPSDTVRRERDRRSSVTYNPLPPSQDHASHNHPEPKWVVDLLLYQVDNQTERIRGSVRKRREGRGIFVRETKDMEGGSGRTEACWARERVEGESKGVKYFGKWFTENFSVNYFPKFC